MQEAGRSTGDTAQTLGELRHSDALALERLWCPPHRCGVAVLNHEYRNSYNILLFHMLFWNIKCPILFAAMGSMQSIGLLSSPVPQKCGSGLKSFADQTEGLGLGSRQEAHLDLSRGVAQ